MRKETTNQHPLHVWRGAIPRGKEYEHEYWASCNPYSNECNGGDMPKDDKKRYWESINDSKRGEHEWEGLSLNDWMKIRYGKVCKMTRERILKDYWRKSKDEDDLEGILDYLEPSSYDGFIELDNEAYNESRCRLLGLTYEEPSPILIEKVKVTRYTISPEEIYIKIKVLGIDEMERTRDNVASIRARFSQQGIGIRGLLGSLSCGKKVSV
ncbi:hypothetical protein Tco_0829040 [Tanacetum coccineum]